MLVKEVMTTHVKSVRVDTRIKDVAILMCLNKISGVPVIEDQDRIVGVISEKDILKAMYPSMEDFMLTDRYPRFEELENSYRDVLGLTVHDLMTKRVFTVTPEDPLLRAASTMFVHKIRRIPVAVDGRLVGIISMGDLHKAIFKETFDQQFTPGAHLAGEPGGKTSQSG